jgi:hypothetical protein
MARNIVLGYMHSALLTIMGLSANIAHDVYNET